MSCPVVWLDFSDNKKATVLAISSLLVNLWPKGIFALMDFSFSSGLGNALHHYMKNGKPAIKGTCPSCKTATTITVTTTTITTTTVHTNLNKTNTLNNKINNQTKKQHTNKQTNKQTNSHQPLNCMV